MEADVDVSPSLVHAASVVPRGDACVDVGDVNVRCRAKPSKVRRHVTRAKAAGAKVLQRAVRAWLKRRVVADEAAAARARAPPPRQEEGGVPIALSRALRRLVRAWRARCADAADKAGFVAECAAVVLARFMRRFVAQMQAERAMAPLWRERFRRIGACWVIQPCVRGWLVRRQRRQRRRAWIRQLRRQGVTEWGLRVWGLADEAGPRDSDSDDFDPEFLDIFTAL